MDEWPLLTTHAFPPVELDYDIIKLKRDTGRRAIIVGYGMAG